MLQKWKHTAQSRVRKRAKAQAADDKNKMPKQAKKWLKLVDQSCFYDRTFLSFSIDTPSPMHAPSCQSRVARHKQWKCGHLCAGISVFTQTADIWWIIGACLKRVFPLISVGPTLPMNGCKKSDIWCPTQRMEMRPSLLGFH